MVIISDRLLKGEVILIVYNNKTGDIKSVIPDDQKPRNYKNIAPEDISTLKLKDCIVDNMKYYKIINGELVRRSEQEIEEIKIYRRVLTEEERLNIILKPTQQEIQKAESTLEILSTLQEVGLI